MKYRRKVLGMLMLTLALVISALSIGDVAFAASSPLERLESIIQRGITSGNNIDMQESNSLYMNVQTKTYNKSGGGYYLYTEIIGSGNDADKGYINETRLNELTAGAKRDFLSDVLRLGNNIVAYEADRRKGTNEGDGKKYITEETMNQYVQKIQGITGAGSQLIASLMNDTKPDYVSANKIYKPFSGVVGTVLGVISILIMSLLGVTMGLDLAYIVIPMFQLFLDGDSDGQQGGTAKGLARIISQEARNAVKAAGNDGGNGQTGSANKLAVSVYFKHRWKSLVVLGICLLYLVQGQIYSFVAWVLDLVSGFVGF